MKNHALIITYSFPPAGGSGVQRGLKFVKYLPEFGWQPIVLTSQPEAYLITDPSLSKDIPNNTPIYRAASPDVNRLRPTFERLKLGKVLSAINLALMLPDAKIFWASKAFAVAKQIIGKHQPSVIFSTSPPSSVHLLALWIHQHFQIPWLADFRDPWSENSATRYFPGYRSLNRKMEAKVLTHCDHITTVSQPWLEMLQRLSSRQSDALTLIDNGYDESDVQHLPPPHTKRFTITYTGIFSQLSRPEAFVAAIQKIVEQQMIPLDELCIKLAGKNTTTYVPQTPPFEHLGYLPHVELNRLRQESDLLALIIKESHEAKSVYTGKIYEYLGCNRPVLCITHPENVAAQLIVRARAGTVARHRPEEIVTAIMPYYHAWKAKKFLHAPDWDVIQLYTRRKQTQRLANIFDQLVSNET